MSYPDDDGENRRAGSWSGGGRARTGQAACAACREHAWPLRDSREPRRYRRHTSQECCHPGGAVVRPARTTRPARSAGRCSQAVARRLRPEGFPLRSRGAGGRAHVGNASALSIMATVPFLCRAQPPLHSFTGSEAEPNLVCRMTASPHIRSALPRRTMIPHARGHRARKSGIILLNGRISAITKADLHSPGSDEPVTTGPRNKIKLHLYALNTAPCGTTPCVTYRQSATNSLRAKATIAIRRIRPRPSPTRAMNHRLRSEPG